MGMSWSQYNQQYARETQGAGAGGGAAPSDQPSTSGSPDSGPPSCSHSGCFPGQDLNKIIKPDIAPFAINHASPEQNDINNNFSTTNQYAQRFGIARAHF